MHAVSSERDDYSVSRRALALQGGETLRGGALLCGVSAYLSWLVYSCCGFTPLCHTRQACDRASYGRFSRGRQPLFSSPQSTPGRAGYIRVRDPPVCNGAPVLPVSLPPAAGFP